MLRSLPVSDPARLYRIGDGDDSTAKGRHGRWGMFSFPLYERLKAGTPEFEDITAFGLAGSLLSVRRQGPDDAARALRDNAVTPPGVDNPTVYRHRSGGVILPRDADWLEATKGLRQAFAEPTREKIVAP